LGVHTSYAIELFKPYFEDEDPAAATTGSWRLLIDYLVGNDVTIDIGWSGTRRFHVIRAEDASAPLSVSFDDPQEPADTMTPYKYDRRTYSRAVQSANFTLESDCTISLQRLVTVPSGTREVTVDMIKVPSGWFTDDGASRSIQRDISTHKCIRRLWATAAQAAAPTLGSANTNVDSTRPEIVQAHPANRPFSNMGELGMVFQTSGYNVRSGAVAAELLLDLRNPLFADIFQYLTVIDPCDYGLDPRETRVKGRININTAPYLVLAQLPWMQYGDTIPFEKARAIVDYRNANGPLNSIARLMQIPQLGVLAADGLDNLHSNTPRGPDLTDDTARDDFEERDIVFTRISNLITVRSDIFTAYIIVRLGQDGPRKRVIAILDRSQVASPTDNVRVVAVHSVPDPR
jgi:hypothetical protein